ncbi:MAG: phage tail sheath family protein [Limnochordales bacterium]|nr:phage tail sheath family protein [Limnochordales bacterium]
MAGGIWSPTEGKVRPGFYLNFVAAGVAAIKPGARGIVAVPVKADWGPIRQVVEISSEAELVDRFGNATTNGLTAYNTVRMALLGGARTVLVYRLADSYASKGSITLKDTASTPGDVLRLETKYETNRPFAVTVRDNPVDSTKQDIVLYEGTAQLRTFTFLKGTIDAAVTAVNGDAGNRWITATKIADGNGTLAAVNAQPFANGNNGATGVTNADYMGALAAFEARQFNLFSLDGATDASLQASVKAWVARLRDEGHGVIAVLGGSATDDEDPTKGNARSLSFNHEGIVNVITSAQLGDTWYSSAQIAPFIAGLIAGQRLAESITYAVCPFTDVKPRLTDSQIREALNSGSLVLVHDGEKVKVEQGINTLTSLREGQNRQWRKIRAIRVMDAINADLLKTASDNYIGKVVNNDDGKLALINACKQYMDQLVNGGLIEPDYTVQLDPAYHPALAAPDEVYIRWDARLTDTMEFIFGTFNVRG